MLKTLAPVYAPWWDETWDAVEHHRPEVVIINPYNGLGYESFEEGRPLPRVVDPGWKALVDRLHRARITVLGYVATGVDDGAGGRQFGLRPLDETLREADQYRQLLRVDGIFWDEIPVAPSTAWVKKLHGLVRSWRSFPVNTWSRQYGIRAGLSVFNPGQWPHVDVKLFPDSVWVSFEGYLANLTTEVGTRAQGNQRCALVHTAADPALQEWALDHIDRFGWAWGYVGYQMPNPWGVYRP